MIRIKKKNINAHQKTPNFISFYHRNIQKNYSNYLHEKISIPPMSKIKKILKLRVIRYKMLTKNKENSPLISTQI